MGDIKKLYEHFEEKFDKNFNGVSIQEAFEKTNQDLGFQAYANVESFQRAKRRKRKR